MIYSLTEKLSFEENPIIEIKGKKYEVKADAETVLTLVDILQNNGEIEAALKAGLLLFSKKDNDALLKFQFDDYLTIIGDSVSIAMGSDPDKEEKKQGEE